MSRNRGGHIIDHFPLSKFFRDQNSKHYHCVKNVRIWSFSGPYFPAFPVSLHIQMRENTDQNSSEHRLFSNSVSFYTTILFLKIKLVA